MLIVERHEANAGFVEVKFDVAGGAAAMLGKDKVGDILTLGIWVVIIFAVNKHYDIRILLDGAGFTKVG